LFLVVVVFFMAWYFKVERIISGFQRLRTACWYFRDSHSVCTYVPFFYVASAILSLFGQVVFWSSRIIRSALEKTDFDLSH
jgi:hypothetical protein